MKGSTTIMASKKRCLAAFQGELGAFSHSAGRKLLGADAAFFPCATFKDVFEALQADTVTHAVVPMENTLHGSVHENYDHLVDYDFKIIGETNIRVAHHLIAMPGTRLRSIQRVYSHPVALNQCRIFFRNNPQFTAEPFYDTAGSVKMLEQQQPKNAAALASEDAAAIYGGVILKRHLEDDRKNFTRFFLLSKQEGSLAPPEHAWKTSLVFSTANVPGALFKAMACFALRDVNLTKIESRPLRGKPWEYLFYVDLNGHQEHKPVQNAISNLQEITLFLKVLGSYQPTP
jgi:prephenate dehydratase